MEIRLRQPHDVPGLCQVLADQQLESKYPYRWPLPFPVEQFIARPNELTAWCALVNGEPVGHVCVQTAVGSGATHDLPTDPLHTAWSAGQSGCPVEQLAVVSALFVRPDLRGRGLGTQLLSVATNWIVAHGLRPCLDVLVGPTRAIEWYESLGWSRAGEITPEWLDSDDGCGPLVAMVHRISLERNVSRELDEPSICRSAP